jgi:formyltetrahydrofolate deformylase
MAHHKESVVLLIHCKDRRGIVARVSGFINDFGGNILDSDHHTDEETNEFLMRMEFAAEGLQIPPDEIGAAFAPAAKTFEMRYEVRPSSRRTRVAMWSGGCWCTEEKPWFSTDRILKQSTLCRVGRRPKAW